MRSEPTFLNAGPRETNARCLHCGQTLQAGEATAVCARCGGTHHATCWQARDGCGSFECAPPRRDLGPAPAALRITTEDIERAVPLAPSPRPAIAAGPRAPGAWPPTQLPRTSRLAIASFVLAILGIPLFGALTGLIAVLLASLAIGSIHHTRQRGTGLAVCGLLLGVVDVVGWLVFLSMYMLGGQTHVAIADFEPDLAALDNLAPQIAKAVKANVLIEVPAGGFRGPGTGSGVILNIADGSALVVTNRHVVDPRFTGDERGQADPQALASLVEVRLLGQPLQPGEVLWLAPDGVDLALLRVPVLGEVPVAALWQHNRRLVVGADVFSIGNPHHLDWTHTRGTVSQLRIQHRGDRKVHVIQTDAAINAGNSGGGLYDQDGYLIGINTWAMDKRMGEGLNFAIALDVLLDLDPPPLRGIAGRDEAKTEPQPAAREP